MQSMGHPEEKQNTLIPGDDHTAVDVLGGREQAQKNGMRAIPWNSEGILRKCGRVPRRPTEHCVVTVQNVKLWEEHIM